MDGGTPWDNFQAQLAAIGLLEVYSAADGLVREGNDGVKEIADEHYLSLTKLLMGPIPCTGVETVDSCLQTLNQEKTHEDRRDIHIAAKEFVIEAERKWLSRRG